MLAFQKLLRQLREEEGRSKEAACSFPFVNTGD
jgi:hypothetical protein